MKNFQKPDGLIILKLTELENFYAGLEKLSDLVGHYHVLLPEFRNRKGAESLLARLDMI